MRWIRQDKGITKEGEVHTIPYPPPKPDHLPLGELVLLSEPFNLPRKIILEMQVYKEQLSDDTWQEFAVFLADNVVKWTGREIGFRFPLNFGSNEFTCYLQYPIPFKSDNQTNYKMYLPTLNERIKYSIEFRKVFLNLYRVIFTIKYKREYTQITFAWLPKKTFSLVLVSHNRNKLEAQHLSLKLYNIQIEQ